MDEQALEEFYSKKFYFSYSSMKRLLYSPKSFYEHYIAGNKEEKISKNLLLGKLIHCLLLEPNELENKFIISPVSTPNGDTFKLLNDLYKEQSAKVSELSTLRDFKEEVLEKLKEINLHQSLTDGKKEGEPTGDEKRIAKICIEQNETYFRFLCKSKNKNVVDQQQYDYAKNAVSVITANDNIAKIMYLYSTEFDNVEIYNEHEIKMDSTPISNVGLKGIIDRIIIDHDKKLITIIDFKTTSKGLSNFKDTVEFYDYDIQIMIYGTLAMHLYGHLDYNFKLYFIVIDEFLNEYAFEVKNSFLDKRVDKYQSWFDKCQYHYNNKSYRLPYEFDLKKEVLE